MKRSFDSIVNDGGSSRDNTAASYIGEIEIGRKFPSIEMVEKLANALNIEAYRLFVNEQDARQKNEEAAAFFNELPIAARTYLSEALSDAIHSSIAKTFETDQKTKN
jgi:transcriptional regulator with XRE-family HTH domain